MKIYPVYVEWEDSQATDGTWESVDSLDDMGIMKCKTIGFLLEDKNDHITLITSITENQVMFRLAIPKINVKLLVRLDEVDRKLTSEPISAEVELPKKKVK